MKFYLLNISDNQPSDAGIDEYLQRLDNIYVVFNFLKSRNFEERDRFWVKAPATKNDIPFFDRNTDCIVLELQQSDILPLPFQMFSVPRLDGHFHLIGHSSCEPKHTDKVDVILDPTSNVVQRDIEAVKAASEEFLRRNGKDTTSCKFEDGFPNILNNNDRFLFHTCLGKGASGSPGVLVQENGTLVVVTMLLHGYPDWFYSERCSDIRQNWNPEYCVEQGANMVSVYNAMLDKNIQLCSEIFGLT